MRERALHGAAPGHGGIVLTMGSGEFPCGADILMEDYLIVMPDTVNTHRRTWQTAMAARAPSAADGMQPAAHPVDAVAEQGGFQPHPSVEPPG